MCVLLFHWGRLDHQGQVHRCIISLAMCPVRGGTLSLSVWILLVGLLYNVTSYFWRNNFFLRTWQNKVSYKLYITCVQCHLFYVVISRSIYLLNSIKKKKRNVRNRQIHFVVFWCKWRPCGSAAWWLLSGLFFTVCGLYGVRIDICWPCCAKTLNI